MSEFTWTPNLHAAVTPAGAYHAATGDHADPTKQMLVRLLRQPATPRADPGELRSLLPGLEGDAALELLYQMQSVGWIAGRPAPAMAPEFNMERDIPGLLAHLSSEGCALLADANGFYLANQGFAHETVEELSVLAAHVATLQQRHRPLIRNNLRSKSTGWAAIDAAGNGQVGFWPMDIARQASFVLVVKGVPDFNQPGFVDLVWWLVRRYAGEDDVVAS